MQDFYVSGIYILSQYDACGNTSVNEKFYNINLNNFSLQASAGKSWKQYTLSSAGIWCGECSNTHFCFRRLSYELLEFSLFLFFSSSIELPRPWKVDQELKMEKRNHLFRDISFTLFFFLIVALFCLVAFWLFTKGQLKILGNLSKRTTSWDLLWI